MDLEIFSTGIDNWGPGPWSSRSFGHFAWEFQETAFNIALTYTDLGRPRGVAHFNMLLLYHILAGKWQNKDIYSIANGNKTFICNNVCGSIFIPWFFFAFVFIHEHFNIVPTWMIVVYVCTPHSVIIRRVPQCRLHVSGALLLRCVSTGWQRSAIYLHSKITQ